MGLSGAPTPNHCTLERMPLAGAPPLDDFRVPGGEAATHTVLEGEGWGAAGWLWVAYKVQAEEMGGGVGQSAVTVGGGGGGGGPRHPYVNP